MRARAAVRFAVVGAGRAGIGLALVLRRSGGYALTGVAARSLSSAVRASRLLGRGTGTTHLGRALRASGVVLICVPDDEIPAAAAALARHSLEGKVVLHTCGVLTAAAIGRLRACGASVGSLHPLTSFSAPGRRAPDLRGTFCAVDGDPKAVRVARAMARAFGGRVLRVPPPARPAYHLAASLVANHLVTLLDAGFDLAARRLRIPQVTARAALMPLVVAAVRNVARAGPRQALTGPVARGDLGTVARHLRTLSHEPPSLAELYRVLSCRAIDLAVRDGRLAPARAKALRRLLGSGRGGATGTFPSLATSSLTRSRRSPRMRR